MGNYVSCTVSSIPGNKQSRCAKVITPIGEIKQLDGPINAAELMFENPNHFLVNSQSLHIGRRFSALNADEELEMGNVYILFPMKRLNSVITAMDMGVLLITANSAAKRASRGKHGMLLPESGGGGGGAAAAARVTPVSASVNNLQGSEDGLPRLKLDDIEDFSLQEFKHRLSSCRSRKPSLETITEEPQLLCSR
ncbi:uncharacterized protein LOC122083087 [Macadamia integrifolia]|uniref:uncharacterized protein LOC122083087 n=1 Tax=Macadamia integrifolia TaxID=60698 RepID=UPI001C4EFBF5|nr:uncharacterized protein LOC122083087 [Macadamia integrifolia]